MEDRTVPANASGVVGGSAFIDLNSNGIREAQEVAAPGVRVKLTGRTNQGKAVNVTALTDARGRFSFLNVQPGRYDLTARSVLHNLTAADVPGFRISGGQTVQRTLAIGGLGPQALSFRQFLASSTGQSFPFGPPGNGVGRASARANNTPTVATPLGTVTIHGNPFVMDLAGHFSDPDFTNSQVRFDTSEGPINIQLFDKLAPRTVANFFNYVLSHRYDSTFFHRLETGFVLQGGGWTFKKNTHVIRKVEADAPVANEFIGTGNKFGTIAMAKLGGDPDSATSEFFFNLGDNKSTLGPRNNGGFTVFGKLAGPDDQATLTKLTFLSTSNKGGAFNHIPLKNYSGTNFPTDAVPSNFAMINGVTVVKRDEALTYSIVSNSNPGRVRAVIKDNRLILQSPAGLSGTARITVRATDKFGAFVDSTVTATVDNHAPTAGVVLSSTAPRTNDILTATVTTSDADHDDVMLTYVWRVNGVEKKRVTTTDKFDRFDLSRQGNGNKGDVITVQVLPSDGAAKGAVATAQAIVANSPPTVSSPQLTPTTIHNNGTLTFKVNAFDADGDPIKFTYVWKLNNATTLKTTSNSTSTTDTLNLASFNTIDPGDQVQVEVTPNDGSVNGAPANASILVANRAPTTLGIAKQTFSGPGNFTLNVAPRFSDPDGTPLTFTARQKNGSALPTWLTFSNGQFSGNPGVNNAGTLNLEVTAKDPSNASISTDFQLVLSNTPTSLNDAPVISSLTLSPNNPGPNADGSVTATVVVADGDNDAVSLTYVWTLNNNPDPVLTTHTSDTTVTVDLTQLGFPVNPGDVLHLSVTPSDGTTDGTPKPASVTINTAPVADGIANQAFNGPGNFTLDVSDKFHDPDGKPLTFKATLDDDSALPAWLHFTDGVFSGNPGFNDAATLTIKVTATDSGNLAVSSTFELEVSNTPTSLNDPPEITALTLDPDDPGPTATGTVTAAVTVTDADNLASDVTLTYIWTIDGTEVQKTENTLSRTDSLNLSEVNAVVVQAGQEIKVEVVPFDGLDHGTSSSATTTIVA